MAPEQHDIDHNKVFEYPYTNHRGEFAIRRLTPRIMWFGTSPYHEGPQWFIRAFDYDRSGIRDFALTGFGHPAPFSVHQFTGDGPAET